MTTPTTGTTATPAKPVSTDADKPTTTTASTTSTTEQKTVLTQDGVELTQADLVTQIVTPTVVDGAGIERITGPSLDNWVASPVEATDEQKKAAAEREAKEKAVREARLAFHETDQPVAKNVQADGGSQSASS